eukprot:6111049-Pleurochrysis_carterae.AAC.2
MTSETCQPTASEVVQPWQASVIHPQRARLDAPPTASEAGQSDAPARAPAVAAGTETPAPATMLLQPPGGSCLPRMISVFSSFVSKWQSTCSSRLTSAWPVTMAR